MRRIKLCIMAILMTGSVSYGEDSVTIVQEEGNGLVGNIEDINSGVILGSSVVNGKNVESGSVEVSTFEVGNGVLGDINENVGVISGSVEIVGGTTLDDDKWNDFGATTIIATGNGVFGLIDTNSGVISGNGNFIPGSFGNNQKDFQEISFSGNGIAYDFIVPGSINNYGLVKGSQSAIAILGIDGKVNNYGILAGREILGDGKELIKNNSIYSQKDLQRLNIGNSENNQGLYVKLQSEMDVEGNTTGKVLLDSNGDPVIDQVVIGDGGNIGNFSIYNGFLNGKKAADTSQIILGDGEKIENLYINASSLINLSNSSNFSNLIINGLGREQGALNIDKNLEITNSIINGYETAMTIINEASFTGTNVTFNGGGLEGNKEVIKGDNGNNVVILNGKSIINGYVNLGDGNDKLILGNENKINGNLSGGSGNDTLDLGQLNSKRVVSALNIFNKIDGFETINTNGDVVLSETANITDAANINVNSGRLTLKLNPVEKDNNGKVIGHAFYSNIGVLSINKEGILMLGLNGTEENEIISMGGTEIDALGSWDKITTNSSILNAQVSSDGKEIVVTTAPVLPVLPSEGGENENGSGEGNGNDNDNGNGNGDIGGNENEDTNGNTGGVLYRDLNDVYLSLKSAGVLGRLANTTSLDNKTYDESIEALYELLDQIYINSPYSYTLKSTRDSLKLFENNLSYLSIKPKAEEIIVQGKGIYSGVKSDTNEIKVSTNVVGGLATAEYGLSNKTSVGIAVGGNNQDIKFKGLSKIDGDSFYIGTYGKTEFSNFKFMSGIGYQYTSINADRVIYNKYDYFKTKESYNVNSLNIFTEAKYIYNLQQEISIEPKLKLSYYFVSQDGVDEGKSLDKINLKTGKVNSNTFDLGVGLDLVKSFYFEKGKVSNILSLEIINTLGDRKKSLKGNIIGTETMGDEFTIEGIKLPKTSGKVGYNLEFEQKNGMIYSIRADLEFAKDYNRNVNVTIGLGYKF